MKSWLRNSDFLRVGISQPALKILIAAGGSGGHLLPAQQLATALAKRAEVLFAGSGLKQSPFFERERFAFYPIASGPLPKGCLQILRGIWQSIQLLRREKVDLVVGFGSYHSFPVLAAAWFCRCKIALFEANCTSGKVIRFFAPVAHLIASQFPIARSQLVPLLPWKKLPTAWDAKEARKSFGLDPDRRTILIFGGSQGAKFLNEQVPSELSSLDVQVIHLTGGAPEPTMERYRKAGIFAVVKSFETQMPLAYAAADVAICRSGAGTMAELIRFALPALLIPFPYAADDHQSTNAKFLAKKIKGAKMILQQADGLREQILALLEEKETLRENLLRYRGECEGRKGFEEQLMEQL